AEHGLLRIELRLLMQEADRDPLGWKRLAEKARVLAGHDLQERALPRAVQAEHADLRAEVERQPDVFENLGVGRMNLPEPLHGVNKLRHKKRILYIERSAFNVRVRRILHVDMDAFYASVEQRDKPALRGQPIAVGGQPDRRGVVAAASYEARAFGVHSAMSMAKAVRLCPSLVIVPPDFSRYKAASNAVFSIFREVTPLVEPLSLDEAYLDVTENAWGEPLGTTVAKRLKDRIRADTQLTASAGVAPNKFLAKIASGWKKPDGLTVISPARVEPFLQRLPVDALWGVGPKTAQKLRDRGIERLVDVRTVDGQLLRDTVGSLAEWLQQLAHGIDDRPV